MRPILLRALRMRRAPALLSGLTRNRATVFMLHRFADPDRGVRGHSSAALRRTLAHLRRERFSFQPLAWVVGRLAAGQELPPRTLVFTLDDGYADQHDVALPILAEFDCPATVFVTTGFLDGHLWFWWDRIEYVIEHTRVDRLRVALDDDRLLYGMATRQERRHARDDYVARCKQLAAGRLAEAVAAFAAAAEVDLPVRAPARYAPMTWRQLRQAERAGMTFGPHTVTHPILARAGDAQAAAEIVDSWRRLREAAMAPVPVFCYPNGQPVDYGRREAEALERAGLIAAVAGRPGYLDAPSLGGTRSGIAGRFELPRFTWRDDVGEVLRYATGAERLRALVPA